MSCEGNKKSLMSSIVMRQDWNMVWNFIFLSIKVKNKIKRKFSRDKKISTVSLSV